MSSIQGKIDAALAAHKGPLRPHVDMQCGRMIKTTGYVLEVVLLLGITLAAGALLAAQLQNCQRAHPLSFGRMCHKYLSPKLLIIGASFVAGTALISAQSLIFGHYLQHRRTQEGQGLSGYEVERDCISQALSPRELAVYDKQTRNATCAKVMLIAGLLIGAFVGAYLLKMLCTHRNLAWWALPRAWKLPYSVGIAVVGGLASTIALCAGASLWGRSYGRLLQPPKLEHYALDQPEEGL